MTSLTTEVDEWKFVLAFEMKQEKKQAGLTNVLNLHFINEQGHIKI